MSSWRQALQLLPPDTQQHRVVAERVDELSAQLPERELGAASMPSHLRARLAGWGSAAVAVGLFVWKFKFALAFAATKGKLLLLGLTKASTVFSMFLSLSLYWSLWGWRFAVGLVASIYVHEMGHVAALRRLGIRASAPMFIPGFGAAVRLKEYPASAREDARVGLAGPLWGMGAAVATYLAYLATGWEPLAATASIAAWLNLFNLLPVWQLDGNRGFRALARSGRLWCVALMLAVWAVTEDGLAVLLALVAGVRAFGSDAPDQSDPRTLVEFSLLLIGLGLLMTIELPGL